MTSTETSRTQSRLRRLRSVLVMSGLFFSAGVLQPRSGLAQDLQSNIGPGKTLCTESAGVLTPSRSVRFDINVLTLAGVEVDPNSKPLVFKMGAPDGRGGIESGKLLLQVPITPSFLPSTQSFPLEFSVFGTVLDGSPVASCIKNPDGNPKFRVAISAKVTQTAVMMTPRGVPPMKPVFGKDFVIITCCNPTDGSCIPVMTSDKDPLLPNICPTGLSPIL